MTCGIYKLNFKGTSKVYIGQSLNIEVRFMHHIYCIKEGRASTKIREAVSLYGLPTMELLEECQLDSLEKEIIQIYNSVKDGFNTRSEAYGGTNLQGENSALSIYPNDLVEEVFILLIGEYIPFKEISSITGVSISVIENISRLKSHIWLKDKYPDKYLILEKLKGNRVLNGSTAKGRGIAYPPIQSPIGIAYYDIPNAKEFAMLHTLNHSRLVGREKLIKGGNYIRRIYHRYKCCTP